MQTIFNMLDIQTKEDGTGEREKTTKETLCPIMSTRDETLAQFAKGRQNRFKKAEASGITIPDHLKGIMLSEGCTLTEQGEQNLKTRAEMTLSTPHDWLWSN